MKYKTLREKISKEINRVKNHFLKTQKYHSKKSKLIEKTTDYTISCFMVIKNGLLFGYPFVESILSFISICDEFIIVEGYGDDGTYETLNKLGDNFPRIKIFRKHWPEKSKSGDAISEMTNYAMSLCKGNWFYYVQADEILHEKNTYAIATLPLKYKNYNSFSFPFLHLRYNFQEEQQSPSYAHAIRMIRNIPAIKSSHDWWTFEGKIQPNLQVQLPFPIFHCGYIFPDNLVIKIKHHSEKLYSDLQVYKKFVDEMQQKIREYEDKELWETTTSPYIDKLPSIINHLVGKRSYFIRQNLLWKGLNLEIGAGEKLNTQRQYLQIDVRHLFSIDIVGDAQNLPFKDNSFLEIKAHHIIEHFSKKKAENVLREWFRVLKIGGTLDISCPDLVEISKTYLKYYNSKDLSKCDEITSNIYGLQDYEKNTHHWSYNIESLKQLLSEIGFPFIKEQMPEDEHELKLKGFK